MIEFSRIDQLAFMTRSFTSNAKEHHAYFLCRLRAYNIYKSTPIRFYCFRSYFNNRFSDDPTGKRFEHYN